MISTREPACRWFLIFLLLAFSSLAIHAQTKSIRLRNEIIATDAPDRQRNLQPQAAEAVVSGLYLLQLDGPLQLAWRARLASSGVDLLRFVPDDAFVVRVEAAKLSQVRALPFVRWLGEYRPEHKTHRALHAELAGVSTNALVPVSLLLSPRATPAEILRATRLFQLLRQNAPSKFGSILSGRVTPAQLGQLAKSDSVLWIEPAPKMKLIDEISSKIVGGGEYAPSTGGGGFPGGGGGDEIGLESLRQQAASPTTNSHSSVVQQLGFDGSGVVVCVADSGLNNGDAATMHPDLAGRVDAFFFYDDLPDAADEHSHGTHVAGIIAGNGATGETDDRNTLYGLGVAPAAHLVAQRIFDADGKDFLPPYETLTHDAVRAGAVIGSNSWGDDVNGRYDLSAAQFDALVRDADAETPDEQPYILEFSAGNAGPGAQTLDSPAVAKNVIATGAAQNDRPDFFIYGDGIDAMADFSSRGPCEDGRIKPDIVAPGTWIASLQSASAPDSNAWLPISGNYQYQGGTSQAGPHASGAAAIFVQYYRSTHTNATPSPALVKAALINSATDMDDASGTDPIPNNDEGWGRITLTNLIGSTRKSFFLDQSIILTNGQVFEQRIVSGNPDVTLKITLAYTDVPGLPAAIPALVNDLDLEVIGPDGALYRGNQFDAGDSIPNPPDRDAINNVEGVHLLTPPPGEYIVRVRAKSIAEDIHGRTNTPPQQDFALVISGNLPLPGEGILIFDRNAYTVPAAIGIKLIDFDLAGQTSVTIPIASDSQSAAVQVKLLPSGSAGVFTGSVATATSPVAGALRMANGDLIIARYQDASPAGTRTAEAVADLVAPVASAVTVTNRFGKPVITWTTDEETRSIIRYGTNANVTLAVTNAALGTEHSLTLDGAAPGATNFFLIISLDEAGNVSTNNNGGRLFSAVALPVPPVLLVDAFNDIILNDFVQLSSYTEGLDATGIGYEIWSVADEGRTPKLEDLKPYRVVIWRAGEFTATWSAADVKAIRDYVESGGGFFMASMEALSRLDEGGFTNFRKNVLHVEDFAVDPGVEAIVGVDNSSLTSGVDTALDFTAYPDLIVISLNVSDTFHPTTNAAPMLFDPATGQPVGVRFPRAGEESAGRVVFFSFPLDTIPMDGVDPNNRPAVLRNVIGFLAPGISGLGTLEFDREEYTIPSRVAIEVTDANAAGSKQISVDFTSDLLPRGQKIPLFETPRPGFFRGFVNLIATNAPAAGGDVAVNDGDTIQVQYRESLAGRNLQVEAVVDSSPPTVSNVKVEPDYSEAVITWDSSEATDSLVQFGESKFLGRTAYAADLEDTHSVLLSGLLPDRDYFFQVTSRDAAGNSVIDDNKGKFYSFRTLKPLSPPFVDDLEHGSTNWTVVNPSVDAETLSILTSSDWQFGRPQNALDNAAHSGTNCWGTNLRGEGNDYANTSLVSPAIDLSGGNLATLRFWHNYDFTPRNDETDILEAGGVYVSTNNGAAWIQLAAFDDNSGGWIEEEIDLSAYLGKVVRLGWAYELFSIDAAAHPGWLVDDVSVTVTNIVPGTLQISNNLAQATFTLDGPLTRNGQGLLTTYTNAPPGEYVITFGDVPFYQTPKPQTNTLAATKLLIFSGQYTFVDTNANGIADGWEKQFFGEVSPIRTKATDTDGDGASDFQEFLAGTNPTNATSALQVSTPARQPGGALQINWPSVPGQAYRVEGSANAVTWNPLTDWFRATRTNSTYTLRSQTNGAPYLFRISTHP